MCACVVSVKKRIGGLTDCILEEYEVALATIANIAAAFNK